ncbi:hypothetical protein [Halorussus sp. AFM4]|uniref:hypothetical protein n=1 Tax=Halorussus sp. AFM4 TaxID=3421651 RepID=UPI003EBBADD9
MSVIAPAVDHDSSYQAYASVPSHDWIEGVSHQFIELAQDNRHLEVLVLYNYGPHEESTPGFQLRTNKVDRGGVSVPGQGGRSVETKVLSGFSGLMEPDAEAFVDQMVEQVCVSRWRLREVIEDVKEFSPESGKS